MTIDAGKARKITARITERELNLILAYIKGAVYGYTAEELGKWFSVKTLFGGRNRDWHGTPLQILYDSHAENRSKDAKEMASKDVGHLLLRVLQEDENRHYEAENNYIKSYREISKK